MLAEMCRAWRQIFALGPEILNLPGPVALVSGEQQIVRPTTINSSREEILGFLDSLLQMASTFQQGNHYLFCSHWVEQA
jgi:hypothetical protein